MKLAAGILLALLGLGWWVFRPTGALQVAVEKNYAGHAKELVAMADGALADTKRYAQAFGRLALKVKKERRINPVVGAAPHDAFTFGDFVTLNLSFKFKKEALTFDAKFDLNKLFLALYRPAGYYDYYLVFRVYELKEENSSEARAVVRLEPTDSHGKKVPVEGYYDRSTFESWLARYMLDQAVAEQGERDCSIKLCTSELSYDLTSVEKAVEAFEMLFKGRNHPECRPNETDLECLQRVKSEFEKALELDATNAHARFGLGLVQFREAKEQAGRESAVSTGARILEGVANIAQARSRSRYLRNLLSTSEWQSRIKQTRGFENFNLSDAFIDSADNYRRARLAFVHADFNEAVRQLSKIKDAPEFIRPHIDNLRLSAQLMSAKADQEAENLLEEFAKLPHEEDDSVWHATYGFHLCRWSKGNSARAKKGLEHIQSAITLSRQKVALLDRRAQKGICLAFIGEVKAANDQLKSVVAELPKDPERAFMRVYYNLGLAYALIDNFDYAGRYLGMAVDFDRSYYDGVIKLELLESFRKSPKFHDWQSDHVAR